MDWIWIGFLIALSACAGSFLNVVIYRLPRGQSVTFPRRSFCPACGRGIRAWDNIPVVSWLLLRGRCRDCHAPISLRYPLVEALTTVLVVGLYVCYFVLRVRWGAGSPAAAWPMFLAHAVLLCGLLACSMVDVEFFIIPLEVMWVCAAVGLVASAASPHRFILASAVSPETIGASIAAVVGLLLAKGMIRWGVLTASFIDVEPRVANETPEARQEQGTRRKNNKRKSKGKKGEKGKKGKARAESTVAVTSAHGVNPRKEILREVVFLAPAIMLAVAAWQVLHHVEAVGGAWRGLFDPQLHPSLAGHLIGAGASLFGLLIGGLCIWGTRILGTLAFGKEAMGMGDVHILAAVGAVTGWITPTIAFFVAPFIGLVWAMFVFLTRRQRELPYGPWLAAATLAVMIFYDGFVERLGPLAETVQFLFSK